MNRQFLRNLYAFPKDSIFKKLHKKAFKKDKKRFYVQSFWLTLERRICTILFQLRVVPKLSYLKQMVLHQRLFMNGFSRVGYSKLALPLDFIYLRIPLLKSSNLKIQRSSMYLEKLGKHKNTKIFESDFIQGVLDKVSKFVVAFILKKVKATQKAYSKFFFVKVKRRYVWSYKKKLLIKLYFFFFFQQYINLFLLKNLHFLYLKFFFFLNFSNFLFNSINFTNLFLDASFCNFFNNSENFKTPSKNYHNKLLKYFFFLYFIL